MPQTQIDHIVLLLSPDEFQNLPSWLSDNFSIMDGGTHSKGTSQNKLILFQDGTYLELFSWVSPPPKCAEPYADFPGWADKPEGYIIDWALTGDDAHTKYDEVMTRLKEMMAHGDELNVTYDQPLAGGRQRKDGIELRWVTSRPRKLRVTQDQPMPSVPFFCHDISPRVLRVPYAEGSVPNWQELVNHPCGAIGVSGIEIEAAKTSLTALASLYAAILGSDANSGNRKDVYEFPVAAPEQARKLEVDTSAEQMDEALKNFAPSCSVQLRAAANEDNIPPAGFRRLTLKTSSGEQVQLSPKDFGTIIDLC